MSAVRGFCIRSSMSATTTETRPGQFVLEGADAGNMAQLVTAILTVLTVAWLLWQGPGAFVKRQIPCHRPKRRDSGGRALR